MKAGSSSKSKSKSKKKKRARINYDSHLEDESEEDEVKRLKMILYPLVIHQKMRSNVFISSLGLRGFDVMVKEKER